MGFPAYSTLTRLTVEPELNPYNPYFTANNICHNEEPHKDTTKFQRHVPNALKFWENSWQHAYIETDNWEIKLCEGIWNKCHEIKKVKWRLKLIWNQLKARCEFRCHILEPCINCSSVTMKEIRENNDKAELRGVRATNYKFWIMWQIHENISKFTRTLCLQKMLGHSKWNQHWMYAVWPAEGSMAWQKIALKQMKLITTLFLRTQYVQVNSHVNPERAARFAKKFYNVVPKMQDDEVIFWTKDCLSGNQWTHISVQKPGFIIMSRWC